jgi:hypothetical protein
MTEGNGQDSGNLDVTKLSREELEAEYQLSQWALTWAVKKLGGTLEITTTDMAQYSVAGRIYYEEKIGMAGPTTVVTFKEMEDPFEEPPAEPKIILLS